MKAFSFIKTICLSGLLVACNGSRDNSAKVESAKTESDHPSVATTTTITTDEKNSNRKESVRSKTFDLASIVTGPELPLLFVRKANLSASVTDLRSTRAEIEKRISFLNGYIANSEETLQETERWTRPISKDSAATLKSSSSQATIHIRIPEEGFEEAIASIEPLFGKIIKRDISTENAALNLYREHLAEVRNRRSSALNEKFTDERKVAGEQTVEAIQLQLSTEEAADNALISRLEKLEEIRWSSLDLQLNELPVNRLERISILPDPETVRPAFFSRLSDAFFSGIAALQAILLLVVRYWWVVVVGILSFIGWKKFKGPKQVSY